jgi:hypothetical protein
LSEDNTRFYLKKAIDILTATKISDYQTIYAEPSPIEGLPTIAVTSM